MAHRKKPLPEETFVVEITGLSHEGRGIARIDNKVIFVFGGLPGETVRVKYTRCFAKYSEAKVVEIISRASHRINPTCPHFGVCGGCQLQHLSTEAQLHHKQKFLEEQLVHQAKVTPQQWLAPLRGKSFGYRQKARLGVRFVEKKNTLLIGFREQGNNKIAILDSCDVLDVRVGHRIHDLRELVNSLENKKHIPQIEIAIGENEVALVIRHLKPLSQHDREVLRAFCEKYHFSLYLQPNGIDSVHKVWPPEADLLNYTLKEQQLIYHFHPLDFTQVNQGVNQKMVAQALDLLDPNSSDRILDLFCGLGNFSLPLAKGAKEVVGVEGSRDMIKRATENARVNGINNVAFYAFDLDQDLSQQIFAKSPYTKILLDPPRQGALAFVSQAPLFKARDILYISCNPATFSRDAAILVHQHGYHLVAVGILDMFPHTAHVETMGLFRI